jgi:hypothetical protein
MSDPKISRELFLAILAMDAYNRGYNSGIGNSATGLGLSGQIGTAQIGVNSVVLDTLPNEGRAQAASFFAISYRWGSDTVISYRGTDNIGIVSNVLLRGDIGNGWVTGAGFIGTQASLAQEFFRTVVQDSATVTTDYAALKTANVTFTGHSLGGGLAGFMAGIYGKQAVIYDNMPFERAAQYCPAICANNNGALLDRAA